MSICNILNLSILDCIFSRILSHFDWFMSCFVLGDSLFQIKVSNLLGRSPMCYIEFGPHLEAIFFDRCCQNMNQINQREMQYINNTYQSRQSLEVSVFQAFCTNGDIYVLPILLVQWPHSLNQLGQVEDAHASFFFFSVPF